MTSQTVGRPPARSRAKRHTSRQRKIQCDACGFIAYASAGALMTAGLPSCGCGARMAVAHVRDLAIIEPDAFEALADSMPTRGARNALMLEAGYAGAIIHYKDSDPATRAKASATRRRNTATRKALEARAAAAAMPF